MLRHHAIGDPNATFLRLRLFMNKVVLDYVQEDEHYQRRKGRNPPSILLFVNVRFQSLPSFPPMLYVASGL